MKCILILSLMILAACAMPVADTPATAEIATNLPAAAPRSARNVDDFDTTTAAVRQAATQVVAGGTAIGTTIATLGAPADPGIWVKTPLVTQVTQGRIRYQGRVINAELRPSGGVAGSGSQISLAAMRLIAAPLTGLVALTLLR
jgi:hypothetical protein